ncbi:LutC/YkgG family protein [Amaricoccus tamworthensis]|uniref:LutC/YkgG family protein n=1 Tax=Amaricoccus tamworthensis TaxID=57002 RepID=UPI003C7C9FCF
MSARDTILARVRDAALARPEAATDREAQVAERMITGPKGIVPHQGQATGPQKLRQFLEKLEANDTTVTRVSSEDEIAHAVARELRKRNLPAAIRMGEDPMFHAQDWGSLDVSRGPGRLEEPVTLSRAQFAIAETGTLVLTSGPDNPVTLTFLGETHFVVLRTEDLRSGFEDMWGDFRKRGLDPRTVNMVSGPSRSADIGQVLQLGAHGPVALHLFMVG